MKVVVRLAEANDAALAAEWLHNTPNNLLDRDIASYPSLRTLAVDVGGKPASFIPFHPVLVVESIGHKPGITPRENAYALRKVQDALEEVAQKYGIAEIWWNCSDPTLIALAKRHGYEVLTTAVTLRKKVSLNA